MSRWLSALLVVAVVPFAVDGQVPPRPPAHGPAPLLYARFPGPTGLRVTFYPGASTGQEFAAPLTVGLRPGYIYRVKVTGLPEQPGLVLYPTFEVRGTLDLPANLRAADHPAPILFTRDDIERVLSGSLVTKVVYLEHPERARPVATLPDQPLEAEVRLDQDLMAEARTRGRPLLIVRLGDGLVSTEKLVASGVVGTVLLPGAKELGPPARRPWTEKRGQDSWCCFRSPVPVFPSDPVAGPRPPEEECMRDGGDAGAPVGLDQDGRLRGLDPADTAAVYTDSHGRRHIAVSNPVCLCVPRFAVLRTITLPAGYGSSLLLAAAQASVGQSLVQMRLPSLETRQNAQAERVVGREKASEIQSQSGTIDITQFQATALVIGRQQDHTVVGTVVQKQPVPAPERPLLLRKSVDKQAAQIGAVVTFTLTYTNQGGQPITDVVVSDSLTGRLEYVIGSAKSDRESVFTMQENEAGSLVLRWQIGGRLQPGDSGIVSFQARVR